MKDSKDSKAAAVAYSPGDFAPRVLARGRGLTADTLKQLARKNGIPVVESPPLADFLSGFKPLESIPEEYWSIVAEILNFVYLNGKSDEPH